MRIRIDSPSVSVVIPTYNRASQLRRCLDALKTQTFKHFEVLICDDGSTDETSQVPKEYCRVLDVTYDFGENSGGPAKPRNRGVTLARAPYIAFLDSDDWWMPQKLEESLRYLERGADIVYHDMFFVTNLNQNVFWRKERTRNLTTPIFIDLLANGNALNTSSVVVRKSLFQQVGGMVEDRNLIAAEDFDAWLRIAKITDKFIRIPQTLGYYWAGGGNISNPVRSLIYLDAIEKRYADAIHDLGEKRSINWLYYAKGLAHYSLGSYAAAQRNLETIRRQRARLSIYLKCRWLLFLIKLLHRPT